MMHDRRRLFRLELIVSTALTPVLLCSAAIAQTQHLRHPPTRMTTWKRSWVTAQRSGPSF